MPIEDAFGNWLAGFIDGEGCFMIAIHRGGAPSCRFKVVLRDDDSAILEEIRHRTRIGVIRHFPETPRGRPQTGWEVVSKADARRLVEILDRFPLRAKKARDFAIWRKAVFAWQRRSAGPRVFGEAHCQELAMRLALSRLNSQIYLKSIKRRLAGFSPVSVVLGNISPVPARWRLRWSRSRSNLRSNVDIRGLLRNGG